MNSLQITLIVIGLVFIGLVLLFNWWQDQQAQKRLNRHFDQSDSDPLLDGKAGQAGKSSRPAPLQSTPRVLTSDSDGPSLSRDYGGQDDEPRVSLGDLGTADDKSAD